MADLSNGDTQSLELASLRATLDKDFIDAPAPAAWKGAFRLPEFYIRVKRDDDERIQFRLHFTIPKKYPYTAPPTVYVVGPHDGITEEQFKALKKPIEEYCKRRHLEAPGSQIIFDIVDYAMQLLPTPALEVVGSLATQMAQRDQEQKQKLANDMARRQAEELKQKQREEAALLQVLNAARERTAGQGRRPRANSDETEVANSSFDHVVDAFPVESFSHDMSLHGITFRSVRLYGKRRQDSLFATYDSDPICEDVNASLPIETHIVDFGTTTHYGTTAGRKELRAIEAELQRLRKITPKSVHLLRILGVKLTLPGDSRMVEADGDVTTPRLVIVSEQAPTMSLWDALDTLEESGSWMSEAKASDYLKQVLSALHALHSESVIHRCINPRCIHLAPAPSTHPNQGRDPRLTTKVVKISKISYFTQLVDLFRANPWSNASLADLDIPVLPDGWLSHEVRYNDRIWTYTQTRDVHDAGVVFAQMIMGLNVVDMYDDHQNALANAGNISDFARRVIQKMFQPPSRKEPVTCLTILAQFRSETFNTTSSIDSKSKGFPMINGDPKTPVALNYNQNNGPQSSSPEMNYFAPSFHPPQRTNHVSRWREDFEQLAELGKGGFGSVIKARNKTDQNVYAVKKVRIRHADPRAQDRTAREVSTLSRLHHRYIVRYFTAWVEDSVEPFSGHSSDNDGSSSEASDTESATSDTSADTIENWRTSRRGEDFEHSQSAWTRMMAKMEADAGMEPEPIESNFPSINFGGGTDEGSSSDEDDLDGISTPPLTAVPRDMVPQNPAGYENMFSILYIQMEFVENQTLKELIETGLLVEDAWKLFLQLVEAVKYLSDAKIIHRDIKLTNIFIDGNGDCKIGDFGLATTLETTVALDPSSLLDGRSLTPQLDMTQNVGTRIYIAPEVLARPSTKGPKRYHHKADLYSLGIVFFEMNTRFSTESERINVIENIRSKNIIFPPDWDSARSNQRELIKLLLQHNPDDRPTAHELSTHHLLPNKVDDEYFSDALRTIARPDSSHYTSVLDTMFSQPLHKHRQLLYNESYELPPHLTIASFVHDHLSTVFRLHGAVHTEIPLFMATTGDKFASFIDRRGGIVSLPSNMLVSFARTAVLRKHHWIKRYYIGNTWEDNPVDGHPTPSQTAVFDVVSVNDPIDAASSGAELLTIVQSIFESFPRTHLGEYCIYVSHTQFVQDVLDKIPQDQRTKVIEIFSNKGPARTVETIRPALLKLQLPRSLVDELEVLGNTYEHQDEFLLKLDKMSPGTSQHYRAAVQDVQATMTTARSAGVNLPILWQPLLLGSHTTFNDCMFFEVRRYSKRGQATVLANGGRYDKLIKDWAVGPFDVMAFGMNIFLDKLTTLAAQWQTSLTATLKKEHRTLTRGYWIPRRCDVYIVSYQTGYIEDRWKLVSLLWQNHISADLAYESGVPPNSSLEGTCEREGILFLVYTRHSKNEVKVKSILKNTEHELSTNELVPWLHQQLKDQKRLDFELASDAASLLSDPAPGSLPQGALGKVKDTSLSQCQLILPTPTKKGKGYSKDRPLGQAKAASDRIRTNMNNGMPTLAIDVPVSLFDAMTRDSQWITNDDLWKSMTNHTTQPAYAHQIREAVLERKDEGHDFLLLFCNRGPGDEGRIQLLRLN